MERPTCRDERLDKHSRNRKWRDQHVESTRQT